MIAIFALVIIFNPSLSLANPPYKVTATGYCLRGKMTNGEKTYPGVIALSRDLVKCLGLKKGPGPYDCKFGALIHLKGVGTFVFKDLMPPKWNRRVDVYFPTIDQCHVFGVRRCDLTVVSNGGGKVLRRILSYLSSFPWRESKYRKISKSIEEWRSIREALSRKETR